MYKNTLQETINVNLITAWNDSEVYVYNLANTKVSRLIMPYGGDEVAHSLSLKSSPVLSV